VTLSWKWGSRQWATSWSW